MNRIDQNKLIRMICILILVFLIVGISSCFHKRNSLTLADYARLRAEQGLDASVSGDIH